jgi:hypothetical protein
MLASRDLDQTISVVERNVWGAFGMVVTYFHARISGIIMKK